MKLIIQRVSEARCTINGEIYSEINKGFMVLVGISNNDTKEIVDKYIAKMAKLRIFEDESGKTNLSLSDVEGEVMMISQFTLYADCKKGNRPGFSMAGDPDTARDLYEYACKKMSEYVPVIKTGIFGADMKISLINDGPFTIILDEAIM